MNSLKILSALAIATQAAAPVAYFSSNWQYFGYDACWRVYENGDNSGDKAFVGGRAYGSSKGSRHIYIQDDFLNEYYAFQFRVLLDSSTYSSCKQTHAHNTQIKRSTAGDPSYGEAVRRVPNNGYLKYYEFEFALGTAWEVFFDASTATTENAGCANMIALSNVSNLSSSTAEVSNTSQLSWTAFADDKKSTNCHFGTKIRYLTSSHEMTVGYISTSTSGT